MIKKSLVPIFAVLIIAFCLLISCKNDIANPVLPGTEPSKPAGETGKEISEIGMLRFIAEYIEEWNCYEDLDNPDSFTLSDLFDEYDLACLAVAAFGNTDGICAEPYLQKIDGGGSITLMTMTMK